ncbi:hypothetical protein EDD18DRAFT_1364443 [Armillaria luteobubalina]|uniref:Uncharacterized protein n=1 Tax=Armillaria luteobubalina TaxID=153913 RepID=A0AA39P8D8_9AGAR|nr:hypothetical protein EDD18DRAFT_1364443 [Armillaria luteobubalina]
MTTRSKKWGAQLTKTMVDPQLISQQGSSGIMNNQGSSAEPTAAPRGASSSNIEMIKAQTLSTAAACAISPLTPAESPLPNMTMENTGMISTSIPQLGLPSTFSSTESQRCRVLDKSPAVDPEWHSMSNTNIAPTPLSLTVESKSSNIEGDMIPVPDEDNADSKLGLAEFESNRAPSPEEEDNNVKHANETAIQTKELHEDEEFSCPEHESDGELDDRSSDSELDGAILANDNLAYDLAHDSNGPWTDPVEDERSTQLFLNELSDHRCTVIHVLAHQQVGILFKRLGVDEIDPKSDIYQEQYNLIITTMVGGQLVMGNGGDPTTKAENHNTPHMNDQL